MLNRLNSKQNIKNLGIVSFGGLIKQTKNVSTTDLNHKDRNAEAHGECCERHGGRKKKKKTRSYCIGIISRYSIISRLRVFLLKYRAALKGIKESCLEQICRKKMEPSEELYLSSGSDHVGPQNRLCVPLELLAGPGDDGAQRDHRRALGATGLLGSGAAQPHEEDQGAGEEPNPSHDGLKEEENVMRRRRKKADQQQT